MTEEWETLYQAAVSVISPVRISDTMDAGGVGAAVLTEKGHIYTGVCIDTACSLGMCAERNALAAMITHGEYRVRRIVAAGQDGTVLSPCAACREFMSQLGEGARDIEVLMDTDGTVVTLGQLYPFPWR